MLCCAMEGSDASSVSAASTSVDFAVHNVRNTMMELLFHVQIDGIFELHVDETELAIIALSCRVALDLL